MAKILIAEDSPTDIQFVKSVLANTNHSVVVAMDGEEADRMIRSEPFDLIILDVVMPKKNGFQICRDIKKDEKLQKIPVIMLTSKDQASDKLWGQKQGADDYLTKPCEPKDLLLAVKKYLG
ncbi:MAG: response regulator [Nitrospiraceae bacterium]|nr:response regulator [Nitrospiraceae bacterium]